MPLPLPVLDDRTYQDLLDEVRERIPITAPEWTDHNASDPGITLLELLAYLSEQSIYRTDRLTERQYRAFLRLIGCVPRRAQVAFTPVCFAVRPTALGIDLPARIQVANRKLDTVFQTGTPFHITDASLQTVLTIANGRVIDRAQQNATLTTTFAPFGDKPLVDDALYLGFDRTLGAPNTLVRLFVFGEGLNRDWDIWQALTGEWKRNSRIRACSRSCRANSKPWEHYGVRVQWELFDGIAWQSLPALKDYTRALSLSGPVRWRSPPANTHQPGGVAGYDDLYFIRCRLIAGNFDCAPRIRGVWPNTVIARHAADGGNPITLEGRGTGRALQRFRMPRAPVVPGSTRLMLKDQAGAINEIWREQANFDRSGGHARDYTVNANTGEIAFGDGREGRVLASDVTLSATWRVGGGLIGNIPACSLDTLLTDGVNLQVPNWNAILPTLQVVQPIAAIGGADGESLDTAKARGYRIVTEDRCAATLADLERVALQTPGVPLALAYAVVEHHPQLGCLPIAGCVTIVIVPRCVNANRDPTPAMCAAVEAFVTPRRPVALEVHVTGPRYTTVSVAAKLALAGNANFASVLANARTALKQFLDPLNGGPNKTGWPVGRTVYRSEILALLDAIPQVSYVAELTLSSDGDAPAFCGDIPVCANGLVISGEHSLSTIEGTRS
jgi:predicted phage baseplate assembly protein